VRTGFFLSLDHLRFMERWPTCRVIAKRRRMDWMSVVVEMQDPWEKSKMRAGFFPPPFSGSSGGWTSFATTASCQHIKNNSVLPSLFEAAYRQFASGDPESFAIIHPGVGTMKSDRRRDRIRNRISPLKALDQRAWANPLFDCPVLRAPPAADEAPTARLISAWANGPGTGSR